MLSKRKLLISGVSVAAAGAITYAAWPDIDEYTQDIAYLREALSSDPMLADYIRYATLAANGHNAQPWRFRPSETGVMVLPDFTRRTKIVDPDDHHLFVSLGCAAENLQIASEANGRPCVTHIRGEAEPCIEIDFGSASPPKDSLLFSAIPLRQSTRSVYDGQPISAVDLNLMADAAREDGVSLQIFTEPRKREDVLEYVVAGNTAQMNDPAFVDELRHWIRFSPEQALATKDGLFGACSGNPAVPSWIGERLFGLVFKEESENEKYRDQIRSSAGVAVFTGEAEDPESWMKVGGSFQRFALQATALGIRTAHINQPIEVSAIREEFSRWLGNGNQRPDLVVRFGRAAPLPMSARRSVKDVLVS